MSDAGSLRTSPAWDLLAAVVYLGMCLGEVWFFLEAPVSSGTRLAGSVVVTLMAVAVAFGSTRPVTAYFVHGTLIGVATVLGMPGDVYPFGNLFLLATLASVAGPRMAWIGLATAMVGVGSYFWRFGQPPIFAAFTMSLWVLAWAAGRASQGRSRELLLAHDRDLSRAAAQTHEAELALEVQRRDIAREIHDLVGHTINVMVVHAGAGRRGLKRDPNEARDALVTIEEVGRGALDELDGLLGSLSRAPGDRRPVQGLEDVAGLVARVGRAGPVATLDDRVAGPVPAAVGATAYRVSRRHSPTPSSTPTRPWWRSCWRATTTSWRWSCTTTAGARTGVRQPGRRNGPVADWPGWGSGWRHWAVPSNTATVRAAATT